MQARWWLVVVALPLFFFQVGCAGWISTSTEVGVASSPHGSAAQLVDVGGGFGSGGHRIYMTGGGGVGYRFVRESPYAVLHGELGYEWGTDLRMSAALTGRGQIGDRSAVPSPSDPTKIETAGDEAGAGLAGTMLTKLPGADQGSGGRAFFGARLTLEVAGGETAEGSNRVYVVGTFGPVLRWAFLDTTEGRSPL